MIPDRAREDVGNIVLLEHVNVRVPDQRLATLFYISGLGLTRDPYLMTGVDNMWVNVGRQQFHLPTAQPQVLRGEVGLVLPDLAATAARLERIAPQLTGTRFAWKAAGDTLEATCPWGNRFRCHAPSERFGGTELAIAYVAFTVPPGTARPIARFYREVFGTPARVERSGEGEVAIVDVGRTQEIRFAETARTTPDYDGHHIQIYVADFSGPHAWLVARKLITEESDAWQYRFVDLVDPESGRVLFAIEHEVRALTHPLYARPLVNRNAAQSNRRYVRGHDDFRGTY